MACLKNRQTCKPCSGGGGPGTGTTSACGCAAVPNTLYATIRSWTTPWTGTRGTSDCHAGVTPSTYTTFPLYHATSGAPAGTATGDFWISDCIDTTDNYNCACAGYFDSLGNYATPICSNKLIFCCVGSNKWQLFGATYSDSSCGTYLGAVPYFGAPLSPTSCSPFLLTAGSTTVSA